MELERETLEDFKGKWGWVVFFSFSLLQKWYLGCLLSDLKKLSSISSHYLFKRHVGLETKNTSFCCFSCFSGLKESGRCAKPSAPWLCGGIRCIQRITTGMESFPLVVSSPQPTLFFKHYISKNLHWLKYWCKSIFLSCIRATPFLSFTFHHFTVGESTLNPAADKAPLKF